MSGTLALAAAIAAMDREALSALVQRRRPQSPANVNDPIGLAAELLRTESIERAIAPLERDDLAALLEAQPPPGPRTRALIDAGLIGVADAAPAAIPEVGAVVAAALDRSGIGPHDLARADELPPPHDDLSNSWYVAALTSVGTAAELLRTLHAQPARLNRNGTVAVASVKVIAAATRIAQPQVEYSLQSLLAAGLLVPAADGAVLTWSSRTADWLDLHSAERWVALASATMSTVPPPLQHLLTITDLETALAALPRCYPLIPTSIVAAAKRFGEVAAHLGLASEGSLTAPGRALLAGDRATALATARADMPPPVHGVYIQPDLSVVVPGPLAPADEAVLASLTHPEQVGIASTRRITEASLTGAFERGFSTSDARAACERLSLTGIPQPLDYMFSSLAERIRSIIVHEHTGDEGRTRIEITREDLRETLLVDRSLQHLQLRAGDDPASLYSRLRADHVFAALGDARYAASFDAPTVCEGSLPDPPADTHHPELPEELARLVERVYESAHAEPGAGGFTRRLELAIRDRSTVTVTASAQGRTHVFTLLPTSLDAGRLRATDAGAGVERTLPVSTITAVD